MPTPFKQNGRSRIDCELNLCYSRPQSGCRLWRGHGSREDECVRRQARAIRAPGHPAKLAPCAYVARSRFGTNSPMDRISKVLLVLAAVQLTVFVIVAWLLTG